MAPSSEARNSTMAAMSCGISLLGRHWLFLISSSAASSTHRSIWRCVMTQPGVTVLTRMLCAPKSRARPRVKPTTAALVVAYTG
ncbi:hypothetical protein D3C87_1930800 [compost metagenome]